MWMTEPIPERRPTAQEILNSEIMKIWSLDVNYE